MDSADRPLEGNRWWHKADDPWQCLAACIELTSALRSSDPEEFISHIPVQQDGTCNGLQHYAALGGDKTGAEQVNLAKGDKPGDVYTAVANLVNTEIDKDLQAWAELEAKLKSEGRLVSDTAYTPAATATDVANEDVEKRASVASVLKGKVTRKVVKQTVMTTVYGVTFIGAKRQIQRQLRDRGDIPQQWQYQAANYLAEKVLSSIGDLFKGASSIQLWLSICARLIGRSILPQPGKPLDEQFRKPMASVIWTTPLGLPVAQPYRKVKKSQISTALQSVFISDPNLPTSIDARAQATAFPPNYIHSLDATHMMMTAVECKVSSQKSAKIRAWRADSSTLFNQRRGLVYASVHDSYWTHACDVDEMSAALRDCFIKLHSQNLLGDLKSGFQERYAGYVLRKGHKKSHMKRPKANNEGTGSKTGPVSKSNLTSVSKTTTPIMEIEKALEGNHVTKVMNIDSIAAEYGISSLPPLAIAQDETLLNELKIRESKAGLMEKSDEQLEAEEEKAFAADEGIDSEDETVGNKDEASFTVDPGNEEDPASSAAEAPRRATLGTSSSKKVRAELSERIGHIGKTTKRGGFKAELFDLPSAFPDIPPRGDFDLEIIRESPYFFS